MNNECGNCRFFVRSELYWGTCFHPQNKDKWGDGLSVIDVSTCPFYREMRVPVETKTIMDTNQEQRVSDKYFTIKEDAKDVAFWKQAFTEQVDICRKQEEKIAELEAESKTQDELLDLAASQSRLLEDKYEKVRQTAATLNEQLEQAKKWAAVWKRAAKKYRYESVNEHELWLSRYDLWKTEHANGLRLAQKLNNIQSIIYS